MCELDLRWVALALPISMMSIWYIIFTAKPSELTAGRPDIRSQAATYCAAKYPGDLYRGAPFFICMNSVIGYIEEKRNG